MNEVEDNLGKAERFNNYFSTVASELASKITPCEATSPDPAPYPQFLI